MCMRNTGATLRSRWLARGYNEHFGTMRIRVLSASSGAALTTCVPKNRLLSQYDFRQPLGFEDAQFLDRLQGNRFRKLRPSPFNS